MDKTCGNCMFGQSVDIDEREILKNLDYTVKEINSFIYCTAPIPQTVDEDTIETVYTYTNADNCECYTND